MSLGIQKKELLKTAQGLKLLITLINLLKIVKNVIYIKQEKIELPSIDFSNQRSIVDRKGVLIAESPFNTLLEGESYEERTIRYRTLGCMTITGAIESEADDLDKVIQEVASARQTERGNRADDKVSEAAMEERKKQGYF